MIPSFESTRCVEALGIVTTDQYLLVNGKNESNVVSGDCGIALATGEFSARERIQ